MITPGCSFVMLSFYCLFFYIYFPQLFSPQLINQDAFKCLPAGQGKIRHFLHHCFAGTAHGNFSSLFQIYTTRKEQLHGHDCKLNCIRDRLTLLSLMIWAASANISALPFQHSTYWHWSVPFSASQTNTMCGSTASPLLWMGPLCEWSGSHAKAPPIFSWTVYY